MFFCSDDGTLWSRCGDAGYHPFPPFPLAIGYQNLRRKLLQVVWQCHLLQPGGSKRGRCRRVALGARGGPFLRARKENHRDRGWQWEIPCYKGVYWVWKYVVIPVQQPVCSLCKWHKFETCKKIQAISFQGVPIKPWMLNWHPATKIPLRHSNGRVQKRCLVKTTVACQSGVFAMDVW